VGKFTVIILMLAVSAAAVAQGTSPAKCEASVNGTKIRNIYIMGDQYEAVAWAYKHISQETCMTPTTDVSKADAILEVQPFSATPGSPAYDTSANVNCTSSNGSTQCTDSSGNELSVDCSKGGCTSTYGPNPYSTMASAFDAMLGTNWMDADASIYTVADNKLLWRSQEQRGDWYGATWMDKLRLGTNSPVCKVGTWRGSKYKNYRYWASNTCGVQFEPLVSIDIKLLNKQAAARAAHEPKP
jgi:hypothetical protein